MQKQRMINMLKDAKEAVAAVELSTTLMQSRGSISEYVITEGTQNLIGQLILAGAIESSGSMVSDSIDKLDKLAQELGSVAAALVMIAANIPDTE